MRPLVSLLRNSAYSFSLNLATKAANVIVFLLIARQAGPDDAGVFSLATTYLLIFSAFTWGLDEWMVRQVARDPSDSARYFGSFLTLRLMLTAGLYAILVLIVRGLLGYQSTTAAPILVMGLALFPEGIGLVSQALLAGHERFELPAAAALLGGAIKVAGAVMTLLRGMSLVFISWTWVAGSTLGAFLVLAAAARMAGWPQERARRDWSLWADRWRIGLPFLVIGFLLTLEYQTDVIILSAVRSEREVGWYSAATTIAFSLMLIPSAFRAAVYPRMARYRERDPAGMTRLYDLSFSYLLAAALPLAVGLNLLAPEIVELLYTSGFSNTITPLRIISWSLIFNFLNVPSTRLLLADERQSWLAAFLGASMALNIGLNLWLAPVLGVVGAAIARVCSTLAFFIPNYLMASRRIQSHPGLRDVWRPVTASGLMALVVLITRQQVVWVPILSGGLVYLVSLLALRGLPELESTGLRVGFLDYLRNLRRRT